MVDPENIKCNFCGRSADEVVLLISAPEQHSPVPAFICDDCVVMSVNVMRDEFAKRGITQDNYYEHIPKNMRKKIAKKNKEKRKAKENAKKKH